MFDEPLSEFIDCLHTGCDEHQLSGLHLRAYEGRAECVGQLLRGKLGDDAVGLDGREHAEDISEDLAMGEVEGVEEGAELSGLVCVAGTVALDGEEGVVRGVGEQGVTAGDEVLEDLPHCEGVEVLEGGIEQLTVVHTGED